jgi:hypothetical protein
MCIFTMMVILSFSCENKKRGTEKEAITCIHEKNMNKDVSSLSADFKNPKAIRLETTGESLVGRDVNKMKKVNDKYYLSCDLKTLLIFDTRGRFVNKIERKGGSPGEYTFLWDFDVAANGNIVIMDTRKILIYSVDGTFIKHIPMEISCSNIKIIDDNRFLIRASGEEHRVYLVDNTGHVLARHSERENVRDVIKNVAFIRWGTDKLLCQINYTNDFLCYNIKTNEFTTIKLLCGDAQVLTLEEHKRYQNEQADYMEYLKSHPNLKTLEGVAGSKSHLFYAPGNRNKGFDLYLMDSRSRNTDYVMTQMTDDISFTGVLSLLGYAEESDAEECFLTYVYANRIQEGLKKHSQMINHPNYQHLHTLLKGIGNIEDENPILFELK